MYASDAREIVMCEVLCQGQPALFSELRLARSSVNKLLHIYEVSHADDDPLKPALVKRHIARNFRGTLLTTHPLYLDSEGSYPLKDGFVFKRANASTLDEFCSRYHIKPKVRNGHER